MQNNLSAEARNFLLELIRKGVENGNSKLPTEREIASLHTASYGTIRLVTAELEKEGFIRKIRGSGTYICPEAADLLQQTSWRNLWFFRNPNTDNPHASFSSWMTAEIRKLAIKRCWKLHEVVVSSHEEFFAQLHQLAPATEGILYLPPTEPFPVRCLGNFTRFALTPLIILDCEFGDISISNITTDNRFGGMLAARQLLEHGYKNLGIVLAEPHMKQQRSRLQGFQELADIAGAEVEIINCHVSSWDDRHQSAAHVMNERIRQGNLPEALFVTSDAGAFGVIRALNANGIVPGKDIALVSFDGVPAGCELTPPLAAVTQPVKEICRTAFDTLEAWEPGQHPQHQLQPYFRPGGTLTVRQSEKMQKKSPIFTHLHGQLSVE